MGKDEMDGLLDSMLDDLCYKIEYDDFLDRFYDNLDGIEYWSYLDMPVYQRIKKIAQNLAMSMREIAKGFDRLSTVMTAAKIDLKKHMEALK